MYPSEDTSKEIEDNEYSDVYITSPITLNNNYINANELISSSKYYDSFEFKFNGLSNSFNLINPKEIYDFILLYDDLFDYLDEIEILLQKYFKNKDYCLEFSLDPEFQSLNQLVIYILIDQTSFDENWGLLRKLNKEIRNINGFPSNLKRLLSVDLGQIMVFDWKKFYDVGIFLLEYSNKEEYQRSGIGRLYYACFGESRLYYKKAFLKDLPSKNSHSILIETLENSIYDEEQELGDYLHKLRNSRNRADYKLKLKRNDVKNSKNNAKLILELLDEFDKNPIRHTLKN